MAMKIKQGDQYSVPVEIELNGESLPMADVEQVEFLIGGYRKLYPGAVEYREGRFYVPITQAESFSWAEGDSIALDARVRFRGGDVMGFRKQLYIGVVDAVSEEVL